MTGLSFGWRNLKCYTEREYSTQHSWLCPRLLGTGHGHCENREQPAEPTGCACVRTGSNEAGTVTNEAVSIRASTAGCWSRSPHCPHGGLYKQFIFGTALSYGSWNKMIQVNLNSSLTFAVGITAVSYFFQAIPAAELSPAARAARRASPVTSLGGASGLEAHRSSRESPRASPGSAARSAAGCAPRWGTSSPPRAALGAATQLSAPRGAAPAAPASFDRVWQSLRARPGFPAAAQPRAVSSI